MRRGGSYQDSIVRKVQPLKKHAIIDFIRDPNYDYFMTLVKSGMSPEDVRKEIGQQVAGIGEGILNRKSHQLGKRFTYFDTFNEWRWFELYRMTSKDIYHFWQTVNRDLYQPERWRTSNHYDYLKGDEEGVYYIFNRFFNLRMETKYTHWMLSETAKLPNEVLNQMVAPKTIPYGFHIEHFDVERTGNSTAKELHYLFREASKRKGLEKDWQSYFSQLAAQYEEAAVKIKKDPRYKGRFIRIMDTVRHTMKALKEDVK